MAEAKKLMKLHYRDDNEEVFVHPDAIDYVEKDNEGACIYARGDYTLDVKETPQEVANIFMSCNW